MKDLIRTCHSRHNINYCIIHLKHKQRGWKRSSFFISLSYHISVFHPAVDMNGVPKKNLLGQIPNGKHLSSSWMFGHLHQCICVVCDLYSWIDVLGAKNDLLGHKWAPGPLFTSAHSTLPAICIVLKCYNTTMPHIYFVMVFTKHQFWNNATYRDNTKITNVLKLGPSSTSADKTNLQMN